MVGSLVMGCVVGNLVLFPAVKNFENLLSIDEVIAVSLVYYFFGRQCMFARLRQNGCGIMSLNSGRNWSKSIPLGQNVITVVISADVSIALQCSPGGSTLQWTHPAFFLSFFLSFSFGVAHTPLACRRWGLPQRLAQCATLEGTSVVLRDTIRLTWWCV